MSKLKCCTFFLLAFSLLQIEKLLMREALERWLEFWSEFFFLPIWWAAGGDSEKWWVGPLAMLIVALAQCCQPPTPARNCLNIFAHIDCRNWLPIPACTIHFIVFGRKTQPDSGHLSDSPVLFCQGYLWSVILNSLSLSIWHFLPPPLHKCWFNVYLFQQNINL